VFIGNITVIESQYVQFYGAPPPVDVKQLIAQAIELANNQQNERALEAFNKIPADMRVPALWSDLGVVFERLNDVASARAAYQSALAKDPGFTLAKGNLARLENAAAPVVAAAAKSVSAVAATSANDVNLLAPEEGGQLLAGAKRELAQDHQREGGRLDRDQDGDGRGFRCRLCLQGQEAGPVSQAHRADQQQQRL
jgi:tetratricopeptide (TPR) repeat protein